jgi:hypothetical protein
LILGSVDSILRGAGGTLQITLYDAAGNPADAGGTTGTATVTDSARTGAGFGTGAAAPGSPFACGHSGAGIYTVTIPNTYMTLDTFDVLWTFPDGSKRETQFQVVGGFLFAPAEVKAFDTALATQTVANIVAARNIVEEMFEGPEVRVAFRPKGARDYIDGSNTGTLILTNYHVSGVVSAKYTLGSSTTTLDATNLADLSVSPEGILVRRRLGYWPYGVRNCEIFYEYGMTAVPADIRQAALEAARFLLVKDFLGFNPQAIGEQTALGGFIRFSYPGDGRPFGFPNIDAALARYSQKKVIGYV